MLKIQPKDERVTKLQFHRTVYKYNQMNRSVRLLSSVDQLEIELATCSGQVGSSGTNFEAPRAEVVIHINTNKIVL